MSVGLFRANMLLFINSILMNIRQTTLEDLDAVMDIYACAKAFMRSTGNLNQWDDSYPSRELIRQEICAGHSLVCENGQHEIVGTFCFIVGKDSTYLYIEDGGWLNDAPYAVVHRLAANGKEKGVFAACLRWCFGRHGNIRVDTHRDNLVMRHLLLKHGFRECGIIYTRNSPRIAFQKCEE